MPPQKKASDARTEQGRQLARRVYDYKIDRLENMSPAEKEFLQQEFPLLTDTDFHYVIKELLAAKHYEQEKVGWQTIPHDVSVIVLVLMTSFFDLQIGIITGVAVLVLLEGVMQFVFNRRVYRLLSLLVWLTYPAYIWLAYLLNKQGFTHIWIAITLILVWGGAYLLGVITLIPMRMFFEAREKAKQYSDKESKNG